MIVEENHKEDFLQQYRPNLQFCRTHFYLQLLLYRRANITPVIFLTPSKSSLFEPKRQKTLFASRQIAENN